MSRTAAKGQLGLCCTTNASTRRNASSVPLAWQVLSEPLWPVFIAASMSMTSAPRISPSTNRSGRRRRAVRTRSVIVMAGVPSTVAVRVSNRRT